MKSARRGGPATRAGRERAAGGATSFVRLSLEEKLTARIYLYLRSVCFGPDARAGRIPSDSTGIFLERHSGTGRGSLVFFGTTGEILRRRGQHIIHRHCFHLPVLFFFLRAGAARGHGPPGWKGRRNQHQRYRVSTPRPPITP